MIPVWAATGRRGSALAGSTLAGAGSTRATRVSCWGFSVGRAVITLAAGPATQRIPPGVVVEGVAVAALTWRVEPSSSCFFWGMLPVWSSGARVAFAITAGRGFSTATGAGGAGIGAEAVTAGTGRGSGRGAGASATDSLRSEEAVSLTDAVLLGEANSR